MQITIALFLVFCFLCIAAIHFYWGLGGKWGLEAALPVKENNEKTMNPGIMACFLVGLVFIFVCVFLLIKVKFIDFSLSVFLNKYGLILLASVFLIRALGDFKYAGFTKKLKNTTFAQYDTKYYSPFCLITGLLLIILNTY